MSAGNCQLMHYGIPTSKESDTWSSVFVSQVSSEQKSLLFVKRLVSVVVSSVTYLRGLFPEEAYEEKVLDGLTVKILLKDPKSYPPKVLVRCLTGAFEAIEKRYVDELRLVLYDDVDSPECLREAYAMKFAYAEGGGACGVNYLVATTPQRTLIDLKGSTQNLLRTLLVLTQSLEELPDRVCAALHLTYREETPLDYEPPWFYALPGEELIFPQDAVSVKVGVVSTLHHKVSVRVKASNQTVRVSGPQSKVSSSAFVNSQSLVPCSEEPLSPAEPSFKRRRREPLADIQRILQRDSRDRNPGAGNVCGSIFGRSTEQETEYSLNNQENLGVDLDATDLRDFDHHKEHCSICNSHRHKIALKPSVKEQLKTPTDSPVKIACSGVIGVGAFSPPAVNCAVGCAQRSQGLFLHVREDVPADQQNGDPRNEDSLGRDGDGGRQPDRDSAPTKESSLPSGPDGNRGGELEDTGKAEEGRRGKGRPRLPRRRIGLQRECRSRELTADEAKAQQGGGRRRDTTRLKMRKSAQGNGATAASQADVINRRHKVRGRKGSRLIHS
ncbi:uncharacterized protein LOC125033027 isoform X2 [Penaeus chinensis]|uniref:uncharacterized protein LOC125033027 isoform X2 n=1 Tax=Penaeus chinensis TaxID=139456 RepID=UPI001FB76D2F|nr:uncharacterized protein LOC125033027 isoform X2 [Penaeus chinensis]